MKKNESVFEILITLLILLIFFNFNFNFGWIKIFARIFTGQQKKSYYFFTHLKDQNDSVLS